MGVRLLVGDLRSVPPRSIGRRISEALRHAIRGGQLPAGTPLPSSRALAADLEVSRGVVVRAYEQLIAEGYLSAHTGQGTRVGDIHASVGTAHPSTDRTLPPNPGLPAMGLFPRREWLRAVETALREMPDAELGYGDPRGHPRLRRALSSHLARTRAVVAPVDQIIVTSGYAQGIRLVAEALAHRGLRTIGMEDPGSIGIYESLWVGGLVPRPLSVDDHGLVTSALRAVDVPAIVVTPAHQFPTGAVLAPQRRSALLEWADLHNAVVVEDDYDAEYRYDRAPVGALQGLSPDRVVYGGSVSKSLAPGLRIGWLVAPSWLAASLTDQKSWADIAAPVIDQVALAAFIESGGLDRHIRRTAVHYGTVRRRFLDAVRCHLPGWTVAGVAAGLHAVLLPPPGPFPSAALEDASNAATGLLAVPLSRYSIGDRPRPGLVVGYGAVTPDQIDRGVTAMARSLAHLTGQGP